jgi:hypothetical protein
VLVLSKSAVHTALAAAGLVLLLGGCAGITQAGNAYDELFAPVEGLQRGGRVMQKEPLQSVAAGTTAWNDFELARRLDAGLGVARDPVCAVLWYREADRKPYTYEDWSHQSARPFTYTKIGIPQARIAIRRLQAAGAAMPEAKEAQVAERQRCSSQRSSLARSSQ